MTALPDIPFRFQTLKDHNANISPLLDDDEPSLDDTTFVDALVADDTAPDYMSFGLDGYSSMRMGTPSVPPGFDLPHAHPPPPPPEIPVPKPVSRIVPTSAPFTPSRKPSAALLPSAVANLQSVPRQTNASTSKAKEQLKASATTTGLSATIASHASKPALQAEDFPALDSPKPKATPAVTTPKPINTPSAILSKKPAASEYPTSKVNEKKSTPSLNISVPKATPKAAVDTPSKQPPPASAFPALPTSTAPTVQSPLARNVPKTLRISATPKTETPTVGNATPSSVISGLPPQFPSRQAIVKHDRPDTPTSEMFSEDASITSFRVSRPNSPPPGPSKIGSAPIRTTTKASMKKLRQERKEKDRIEIEAAAKPAPEVEIAPIMGRKKKQKKERGSTPAASRPASPGLSSALDETKIPAVKEEPADEATKYETPKTPTREPEENKSNKIVDIKGKGKAQAPQPVVPDAAVVDSPVEEQSTEQAIPTPASIFGDVFARMSADYNIKLDELNMLKPVSSTYRHPESTLDKATYNPKLTITPDNRATLAAGKSVHKLGEMNERIMLTPNGDAVRCLAAEEEKRYLDFQQSIARTIGPGAFVSSKYASTHGGFTLVGGRAVPNGPPSYFPTLTNNTSLDPVSKIQRDEALNYINQYVLPSLSSNTQLEKALNAQALEGDRHHSSDAGWSTYGVNADLYINGTVDREGMIATGLENMTAHFSLGGNGNSQAMGNVNLLSLSEAEIAMILARKEAENLEKRLNALIKKNRRMLVGSAH